MPILNYGSLNIDHVYRVDHLVRPGETISADSYVTKPGGKGANQSAAAALAGAQVLHAGKIGADGRWLLDGLDAIGVDTSQVRVTDGATGHAIIEVDAQGQNAIVIHGGGNREITRAEIDETLADVEGGTTLLLQNEINEVPYLMEQAEARGLPICFNPAPMDATVLDYPLQTVSTLVVNETEGAALVGEGSTEQVLDKLAALLPGACIVLTLGAAGVMARSNDRATHRLPAEQAEVVDTTAAGDTFIGYFLARRLAGDGLEAALRCAVRAAAICVSREGARPSIPRADEVGC